jgi:hypothetical protein
MENNTNFVLSTRAKEYKPKQKVETVEKGIEDLKIKDDTKILYNLNATVFKPKVEKTYDFQVEDLEEDENDDDEDDKIMEDLIAKEQIELPGDDDESDDDKWFPKYKDCTCCKGYVYKCEGDVCKSLGSCFCKAQEDFEPEDDS